MTDLENEHLKQLLFCLVSTAVAGSHQLLQDWVAPCHPHSSALPAEHTHGPVPTMSTRQSCETARETAALRVSVPPGRSQNCRVLKFPAAGPPGTAVTVRIVYYQRCLL